MPENTNEHEDNSLENFDEEQGPSPPSTKRPLPKKRKIGREKSEEDMILSEAMCEKRKSARCSCCFLAKCWFESAENCTNFVKSMQK